jgi:hypothetical protein
LSNFWFAIIQIFYVIEQNGRLTAGAFLNSHIEAALECSQSDNSEEEDDNGS